ncbi:MAG TPA: helix-turn-helix transcriptional regulator [Pyrinomonadaceae bacterium]
MSKIELTAHLAARIRALRTSCNNGTGISQEKLAHALNVAPNTISRWETGVYIPAVPDLEKLARFFNVSVSTFFPSETVDSDNESIVSLLRTAKQLQSEDLEELRKYAEFRRVRRQYENRAQQNHRSKRKAATRK